MYLTVILFTMLGLLISIGGGVVLRVMFPELASNSRQFRKSILLGAVVSGSALGLFPALGCIGLSLIVGQLPRASEVLGLALPGVIVFIGGIVLTPISYKLAGRIIPPRRS